MKRKFGRRWAETYAAAQDICLSFKRSKPPLKMKGSHDESRSQREFRSPGGARGNICFHHDAGRALRRCLPYFKDLRTSRSAVLSLFWRSAFLRSAALSKSRPNWSTSIRPSVLIYNVRGRHALGMMDSDHDVRSGRDIVWVEVKWRTESIVSGTLVSLANGILIPLAKRQIKSLLQPFVRAQRRWAEHPRDADIMSRGLPRCADCLVRRKAVG